ncbi:EAL domain-containing protein [Aliikangiella marina]|uniref:EAL domain-containing protein n=1 Tax=Aliikangiella marina TaxID=1712262 RepID=A0A545TCE4_9GAMM|nr:EAL domain-containing protein [Aliikangiella marina]
MSEQPNQSSNKANIKENKRDLQARYVYMDALFDFIIKINQINSVPEIIWHLAQHTIKSLDFEDCVIYLLEEDDVTLKQVAAYGPKSPYQEKIINPITLKIGEGIVGRCAKSKQSVIVKDTSKDPNYIVDDQSRASELAVPIIFKNKVLGVIDSEHSQRGFFSNEHQRYLEILASALASKLTAEQNVETLEELVNAIGESKKLSDIYLEISNLTFVTRSKEELYTRIHEIISRQVKAQSFFVVLYNKQTNKFSFPYIQDDNAVHQFNFQLPDRDTNNLLVAEVIKRQKAYLLESEDLKILFKQNRLIFRDKIPTSWMAVPFEIDDEFSGAIAMQSYDQSIQFSYENKEFLTFLGQHISSAIGRKIQEQRLQYQALHDQATGIPNRALFMDRLEHAFSLVIDKSKSALSVLFIDLDDFKLINDKYGHQKGDLLLRVAANQIGSLLSKSDTLARIGGDEFAVLLESNVSQARAIQIANLILERMRHPIRIDNVQITTSISIGIALIDKSIDSAESLLKNASHAMYHAKKQGKNNIKIYEVGLHQAILKERVLIEELKIAIEKKQLIFYFQPIVNLASQKVVGFEALMRWDHPTKGIIAPGEFIQVAEQNNLIREIDRQLLVSVGRQLQEWGKLNNDPIYISFNISAHRFVDSLLIKEIKQTIRQFSLDPSRLVIELTESVLMENIGKARHLFHQLKLIGVKISLDDFGTGYSSLSYLNHLPFDILKIDRSFVTNINHQTPDHPIINMIVALAKTMQISLVAEGIETELQLEKLTEMGCQYGQGYHFAKPVPKTIAEQLVVNTNLSDKFTENASQFGRS